MATEIIELGEQELRAFQALGLQVNITHFGHKHKLLLCKFVEGKTVSCSCCNQKIRAPIPAYCCIECKYYIHICCVEIPKIVDHPFHRQHLLHTIPLSKDESRTCKACTESISGVSLSCSSCLNCRFDLHVSCIKPSPRPLKLKSHNHNLFYFNYKSVDSLECSACKTTCDGSFFRCVDCNKNFHLECIPIPRIVKKDKSHQHPVMLLSSLQLVHDNEEYCCDICYEQGNSRYHAYYCEDCQFIAHVECLLLEDDTSLEIEKHDDSENKNDKEILNFQLVTHEDLLTSSTQKPKQRERKLTISHFCHGHELQLCNLINDCKATCSYCRQKMLCGLAYICVDCRFIIHESCLARPQEILHQFHPKNPLSASPVEMPESVTCNACTEKITGIKFSCSISSFTLHVSCANKPLKRALKHEFHEHDLFYFVENGDNFFCNKCCKKCKGGFYRCPECGINLHVDCIPVPRIMVLMEHTRHRLNLILLDIIIEDHSEDHHCEFCKKAINPEDHVYYCQESNFFAHIECLFAEGNIISQKKLSSLGVQADGLNEQVEPSMIQDDNGENAAEEDEGDEPMNISELISGLFSHVSLSSLRQRSYAFGQTCHQHLSELCNTTQLQKHFFLGLVYFFVLLLLHSLGFFLFVY